MMKKDFYSKLLGHPITTCNKDYAGLLKAELLYRIDKLKRENCSCLECSTKLEELISYYDKLVENERI